MNGEDHSGAAQGDQLSVVQLSRLHERVLRLREHLRAALLSDGPQLEMIVFTAVADLYEHFYLPLFCTHAAARLNSSTHEMPSLPSAETRFVTSAYTQDILAACLYLVDVDTVPEVYAVPAEPPSLEAAHSAENASTAYVSSAQRQFCSAIFMYVCWSPASLPLRDVLQALYPLLDPGAVRQGSGRATATAVENVIAAELFAQPRFARRKAFIAEVLSGLVSSRANGVRALLRVLLLNDRVEADMTVEAAELVVRVLTAPPPLFVWVLEAPKEHADADWQRVVRMSSPSVEAQVAYLAPQLLSLLQEHAAEKSSDERQTASQQQQQQPRFLARMAAVNQRLPVETLEQRLHLFTTRLLNTLVRVPARSSPQFPRCYRLFFYTNRSILSPGFGCLSLRRDGVLASGGGGEENDAVVAALLRLTSLVKGVSLGAGTGAVSQVLPATAPGILNLCALSLRWSDEGDAASLSPDLQRLSAALRGFLLPLLSNSSLHGLTAHALVQACITEPTYAFSLTAETPFRLAYGANTHTSGLLSTGLASLLLLFSPPPPPGFVHACVEAIIEACQLKLYATGVESLSSSAIEKEDAHATALLSASPPPLVSLLERLCLEAPSAAIFGTGEQLTLPSTLALLGRVLGLSAVLYRWALGMLDALLGSASLRSALQRAAAAAPTNTAYDPAETTEEQRRFLRRLVRAAESLLSSLSMLRGDAQGRPAAGALAQVHSDDVDVLALTAQVTAALQRCIAEATHQLSEATTAAACTASSLAEESGRADNEAAVAVAAQWQRLLTELQAALDCRAAAEVAMLLTTLSRSVDDVVHDVADPQLLVPVVQPLLLTLTRVLYDVDEVGCAVRAVHCITWLCMYRFDSVDSSYIADVVWAVLGEPTVAVWLATQIGLPTTAAGSAGTAAARASGVFAKVPRLRVRLLDVLLAWTDYDDEARTLRNVDDVLRRTRHTPLFDVLVRLCHNRSEMFVQVATLHFVGAYVLAVHPRVPLAALCDLCRDVFRLSPHEMAKAACAAALGKAVAALCHSEDSAALLLTEVDVEGCQRLASAMASYRGRPADALAQRPAVAVGAASNAATVRAAEIDMHDAVIQQHGRDMLELLRRAALSFGSGAGTAEAPSALRVEMPSVKLP